MPAYKESDGRSVIITLSATAEAGDVLYVDGFLGVLARGGEADDVRALFIDHAEYQFPVPDALSVSKGDTVYIDTTQVSDMLPDAAGYSTSSGANTVALCKATDDKNTGRGTGKHFVTGILLPDGI